MDVARNIARETEAAKVLLANIRDVIEDDEKAAFDAVEGQTNLIEAIEMAVLRIQTLRAFKDGIAKQLELFGERMERFERQGDRLRQAILVAMGQADLKKLELATATLSRMALPPKVAITNEADIPEQFWKPSDPKLDRKSLLGALKNNENVPGATLSNGGEALQFRGK